MTARKRGGTEPTNRCVTCESALRQQGIDGVLIARKLKKLLEAKDRRWNPKKQSWEEFDDHRTRLAVIQLITKILDPVNEEEKIEMKKILIVDVPRPDREPFPPVPQTGPGR